MATIFDRSVHFYINENCLLKLEVINYVIKYKHGYIYAATTHSGSVLLKYTGSCNKVRKRKINIRVSVDKNELLDNKRKRITVIIAFDF
jgi:hypothetical protein